MYKTLFLSILFAFGSSAFAANYSIDPAHSQVTFKVRHLGISTVTGRFDKFEGNFSYDSKDVGASTAEATIDLASVNTNDGKRDGHLKDCDFFCVKDFAKMTFKAKKVTAKEGNKFEIVGDLSLKGVTKSVTLQAEFQGEAKDPWGNQRAAFSATGTINRKDFGLTWDKLTETGGILVGSEVTIVLEIEGIKKA